MNANKKTYKIVGIGEVVFDVMPDKRKLGGAPADFLRFAVNFGAEGYLISAIGADDLGREVITELKKYNITPVVSVTPYPTGRVLIFNNPDNTHTAHILENAAWDYIPYTKQAIDCIKLADAVYFDTLALRKSYSKSTIFDMLDCINPNSYRFFDINLRYNYYDKDIVSKLLKYANILKINTDELKILKEMFKISGVIDNICLNLKETYNLDYVILTNEAKENFIFGPNQTTYKKNSCFKQPFGIGVGNAFAGAFMSSLLNGNDQETAHHMANEAALKLCQSINNQV